MPAFKPAYLIHGDDHGRIAERRARLRALAHVQSGASGAELLEGDAATPEAVLAALNALTFVLGRRFVMVDGVERWKDDQLDGLVQALGALGADTTIAFFAREDGRFKAPQRLHQAVRKAGGVINAEQSVKPWELPRWVMDRAHELGLELEQIAARALVHHVGERQQRLLRELEKLALGATSAEPVSPEEIEALTAPSGQSRAWSLADALLAQDADRAVRAYLALRAQGERLPGLLYLMAQRLRMAHDVTQAIDAGEAEAQVKRRLRMPARAAERLIADARHAGVHKLRTAIEQLADLELASRGGGARGTSEDTAALLAIRQIAS
ncbi:MAG: DNA polymerase III subunit delta [Solirubrobacteraceae bacterium]